MQHSQPRSILKGISAYAKDSEEFMTIHHPYLSSDATLCAPRPASHARHVQFSETRKVLVVPRVHNVFGQHLYYATHSFTESSTTTSSGKSASQGERIGSSVISKLASTLFKKDSTKAQTSLHFDSDEDEDIYNELTDIFGDDDHSNRPATPSLRSRFDTPDGGSSDEEEIMGQRFLPSAIEDLFYDDESELSLSTDSSDSLLKTPIPVSGEDDYFGMAGYLAGLGTDNEKDDDSRPIKASDIPRLMTDLPEILGSSDDEAEKTPRRRTFRRVPNFRGKEAMRSQMTARHPRSAVALPFPAMALPTPSASVPSTSTNPSDSVRDVSEFGVLAHKYSSLLKHNSSPTPGPLHPSTSNAGPRPRAVAMSHTVGSTLNVIVESAPEEESSDTEMADETITRVRYSRVREGKRPAWASLSVDQTKLGRF